MFIPKYHKMNIFAVCCLIGALAVSACKSSRTLSGSGGTHAASNTTPGPIVTSVPTPTRASLDVNELDFFLEVAMGAEYGISEFAVKKWTEDLRIQIIGAPSAEDLITLEEVTSNLNSLLPETVKLRFVEREPNVEFYFIPESEFYKYEPSGVVFSNGFFWAWWTATGKIHRAIVIVATEDITQSERSHLIREELTQVLGLMNDTMQEETSIFYQGKTETQSYSDMDRAAIKLLYSDIIKCGMTEYEVREAYHKHVSSQPVR